MLRARGLDPTNTVVDELFARYYPEGEKVKRPPVVVDCSTHFPYSGGEGPGHLAGGPPRPGNPRTGSGEPEAASVDDAEAALTEAITEKTYRATLFGWILQREMAISPNVRC